MGMAAFFQSVLLFSEPHRSVVGEALEQVQRGAVGGMVDLVKWVAVDVESVQILC